MNQLSRERLSKIVTLTGTELSVEHSRLPLEPAQLFAEWLDEAIAHGVEGPLAATLSTVDRENNPDSRILLLKEVTPDGWSFASHSNTGKAEQLARNDGVALCFWWQPVMRSVRLRGRAVEATAEQSLADFNARPTAARRGMDAEDWKLWYIKPERVEFWNGSKTREHTRIIYELARNPDGEAVWAHSIKKTIG